MTFWLALLALVVLPFGYYALLADMRESGLSRPPSVPFFFLFGTLGGWLIALMLFPSVLTSACVLFLATAAPLALLISSLYLAVRPERSVYHRIALWGGFAYLGILIVVYALCTFILR